MIKPAIVTPSAQFSRFDEEDRREIAGMFRSRTGSGFARHRLHERSHVEPARDSVKADADRLTFSLRSVFPSNT